MIDISKTEVPQAVQTLDVMFKCPDTVSYALNTISDENQKEAFQTLIQKFVQYGECVTIRFDLNNNSATVVTV